MSYVDSIAERFGGVRAMARALNRPVSTVGSWKERGSIPDAEKPRVREVGLTLGLDLTPADFFPAPPADDTAKPQPEADAA